ncbi:tyrosine-protein kinase Lyn-like isoform X2 [Salvelinus alpinus]|uniref:tyrosine-protein kinase Lyn-like isoform X2 n=1 Tax=Salvelinus alpinus TaxID=8036 RepID=UPI0039FBBE89
MGNIRTSPVSMPANGDDTNTSSDPFLRNNDTLRVLSDYPSADVSESLVVLSDYPSADVGETLVVLSDYPSADVSAPLFRIGERLRLLAEEGYWWRARSVQTGYENYIPNSHVAKVYHGGGPTQSRGTASSARKQSWLLHDKRKSKRSVYPVCTAQGYGTLSYYPPSQQLVLHLSWSNLPVSRGPRQPLLW